MPPSPPPLLWLLPWLVLVLLLLLLLGGRTGNCEKAAACTAKQFACLNDTSCVPESYACDGVPDCSDASDESNCTMQQLSRQLGQLQQSDSAHVTCMQGSRMCGDNSTCVDNTWWCDDFKDCPDNSDERNCGATSTTEAPSSTTEAPINSTKAPSSTTKAPSSTTKAPSSTTKAPRLRPQRKLQQSCGPPPPKHRSRFHRRIFGGEMARKHMWPWMVSLRLYGGHFCGGSIYNERWIITAAHCAECDTDADDWQIDAGRHCRDCDEKSLQRRKVVKIVVHSNYNVTSLNCDIAMMQVDPPFRLNAKVSTVCLPSVVPPSGTYCFVTGWGVTKGTGDNTKLLQALVPIMPSSKCGDDSHYGNFVTKYMLCAGYDHGGKDACQGDSGGPLVCKSNDTWFLQGVTSWGAGCGKRNSPGVYTRVQQFIDWIGRTAATGHGA